MNSESRIEANGSVSQTERIGGNVPTVASAQSPNAAQPTATPTSTSRAKSAEKELKK